MKRDKTVQSLFPGEKILCESGLQLTMNLKLMQVITVHDIGHSYMVSIER